MASKLRAKTRSKRTSKPRRSAKKNVDRFTRSRKTKATERAAIHSGESTRREKGIMASRKANKIKSLEQSIGSLDRRINNALEKGDTGLAKDLRSRQNKFTSKLGYQKAIKSGGVLRDSSGRITRTGEGNPILNTKGRGIFDETKDMDFIDPTRRIQNVYPDAYGQMYPISNAMQRGLPALTSFVPGLGMVKNIAKSALSPFKDVATDFRTMAGDVTGRPFKGLGEDLSNVFKRGEKKGIPYTDPMMPGERYALDRGFGAFEDDEVIEEEDFFGGRSKDPNYKQPYLSYPGYNEEVKITDLGEVSSDPYGILESQGIDENFIYPAGQKGEPAATPLQLAYQKDVAELMKNLNLEVDAEGKYIGPKLDNPFMLAEEEKEKLRQEAEKNKRVLSDAEKQNLEDLGVSEAIVNQWGGGNAINAALAGEIPHDYDQAEGGALDLVGDFTGANLLADTMGKGVEKVTGWNTQPGNEWWNEQQTIQEDTRNKLKDKYYWLDDTQIDSLLNTNTGFTNF